MNLEAIEKRLKEVELPDTIILDAASTVRDVSKFLDSHITLLKTCKTPRIREAFESRLKIAFAAIKKHNEKSK